LLNRAEGPVIVVSRGVGSDTLQQRFQRRLIGWIRPTLTQVEQDDIVRTAQDNALLNIDYMIMILVSATIATFGLLLNSAAVIIGAMLVAPLMSPLTALSTGLTVGRVWMAQRALMTLFIGVLASFLIALVIGVLLPVTTLTAEMNARGVPTLLDAGVALAAGVAGAYATARKDIPAALAGVAIAAALMPPICTIGLGVAFGENELAFGATLLFLTNIICIIAAGVAVYVWLGMRFRTYEGITRRLQVIAFAALIAVSFPVGGEIVSLTQQVNTEARLRGALVDAVDPAELVELDITRSVPLRLVAYIRTSQNVHEIQQQVGDQIGEPLALELIVEEVIRLVVTPETPDGGLAGDVQGALEDAAGVEATAESTAAPQDD
jgi:uncharacterized hydrophobic protein (TIGR00271 family)